VSSSSGKIQVENNSPLINNNTKFEINSLIMETPLINKRSKN